MRKQNEFLFTVLPAVVDVVIITSSRFLHLSALHTTWREGTNPLMYLKTATNEINRVLCMYDDTGIVSRTDPSRLPQLTIPEHWHSNFRDLNQEGTIYMSHLLLLIGYPLPLLPTLSASGITISRVHHVIHTRNQIFSHRPSPTPLLPLTP